MAAYDAAQAKVDSLSDLLADFHARAQAILRSDATPTAKVDAMHDALSSISDVPDDAPVARAAATVTASGRAMR
jgi:hypothetical protein